LGEGSLVLEAGKADAGVLHYRLKYRITVLPEIDEFLIIGLGLFVSAKFCIDFAQHVKAAGEDVSIADS
jgi:hypothetical protein